VIAEGELGAGMGALATADRARPLRPGGEVERKLGHPGPFPVGAVLGERRLPGVLRDGEDRLAHGLGQVKPDREAQAAGCDVVEQGVRGAGSVAAHKQPVADGPLGQLRERALEQLDVSAAVLKPALPGRNSPASASSLVAS